MKTIMIIGNQGTGKTLIASAISSGKNIPCFDSGATKISQLNNWYEEKSKRQPYNHRPSKWGVIFSQIPITEFEQDETIQFQISHIINLK